MADLKDCYDDNELNEQGMMSLLDDAVKLKFQDKDIASLPDTA